MPEYCSKRNSLFRNAIDCFVAFKLIISSTHSSLAFQHISNMHDECRIQLQNTVKKDADSFVRILSDRASALLIF